MFTKTKVLLIIFLTMLFSNIVYGAVALGTAVQAPGSSKRIEDFYTGDKVLAATLSKGKFLWISQQVRFAMGARIWHSPAAYIHFGNGKCIITTLDHLFLIQNKKLKRADKLVPGKDYLTDQKGKPVKILFISIGQHIGGFYTISTSGKPSKNMNNHLINTGGVITADYGLQIANTNNDDSEKK